MKKNLLTLSLIFCSFLAKAQYEVKSAWLNSPEKAIDFVKGVADFYAKAKDENGGFHTFIHQDGSIPERQKLSHLDYEMKSLCAISRVAYAFNKAFMLTGELRYLENSKHALQFLYENGWDQEYGGWYFTTNTDTGESFGPYWKEDQKWTFQQEYALVGIISMIEATGGLNDWSKTGSDHAWFMKSFEALDAHLWDDRPNYMGYFEEAHQDWSGTKKKGFTATIDGLNTHATSAALIYDTERLNERFEQLAMVAQTHLVGNMDQVAKGFPESFNDDWVINQNSQSSSIGHLLKTAWCLARASVYFGEETYQEAAEKIMDQVWEKGLYDQTHGAPFTDVNWKTGNITNKNRNHWVLEQGLTGGLSNYYNASDREKAQHYLAIADGSIHFFEQYMINPATGVSYADVSENGQFVKNGTAGDAFKAGFHDAELGYFTYLYAKAFYYAQPFDLYYYYDHTEISTDKTFYLSPVVSKNDQLKILSVSKDGTTYTDFDKEHRALTVKAHTKGIYKVTFVPEKNTTTITDSDTLASQEFNVSPNPFTDRFVVHHLSKQEVIHTTLYNSVGQKIILSPPHFSNNTMVFDHLGHLKNGLYILRIETREGIKTYKIMKTN